MPLLHWHKLGSEKQYSAESWEPQLSLNPSAGKHGELQAKEDRKWDHLKPPIFEGNGNRFRSLAEIPLAGCSPRGCSGTGWDHLLLPGRLTFCERSRGCCGGTLAFNMVSAHLGPKQPLWTQDTTPHTRQTSSSHRDSAKLPNPHLPFLSRANLAF